MLLAMLKEIGSFLTATPAEKRHSKAGPLHLWKIKRQFQIRFLKQVGLRPEHHLLDIGCGTLRGGIPIIEYLEKGHYYGIESRPNVLEDGRKELHEANLEDKEPDLMVAEDLSSLNLGQTFDFIWAFSVLIHMTDEILDGCLRFVNRHLNGSGSFYANVNIGARRDAWYRWQGFPVVWRSWEFYREVSLRHGLHVTDIGSLESLEKPSGIRPIDEQRMLKFQKTTPSPPRQIGSRGRLRSEDPSPSGQGSAGTGQCPAETPTHPAGRVGTRRHLREPPWLGRSSDEGVARIV